MEKSESDYPGRRTGRNMVEEIPKSLLGEKELKDLFMSLLFKADTHGKFL